MNIGTWMLITSATLSFSVQAHDGHYTNKSWAACEEKALAEHCSYAQGEQIHQGSCQPVKHLLVCDKDKAPALLTTSDKAPVKFVKIFQKQTTAD